MKTVFISCMLSLVFCIHLSAQNNKPSTNQMISFKLKNNSILPKKITLISYQPDQTGNGTSGYMLLSFGTKNLQFPVGSKLYLANGKQVDVVMSGASIRDQKPFLVVKKEDEGKTFGIK